jgi:hypothetical protein
VLRAGLRELAAVRRRFGDHRLLILLWREGTRVNRKKLRRLYREERLQIRRRGRRKRALETRAPLTSSQGPNQRWLLDFLSDMLTDSRRFRILSVADDFMRECQHLLVLRQLMGCVRPNLARGVPLVQQIGRRAPSKAAASVAVHRRIRPCGVRPRLGLGVFDRGSVIPATAFAGSKSFMRRAGSWTLLNTWPNRSVSDSIRLDGWEMIRCEDSPDFSMPMIG